SSAKRPDPRRASDARNVLTMGSPHRGAHRLLCEGYVHCSVPPVALLHGHLTVPYIRRGLSPLGSLQKRKEFARTTPRVRRPRTGTSWQPRRASRSPTPTSPT